jgi:DMSO/TMAO reductase YedYZ heme-binding membrane subunit
LTILILSPTLHPKLFTNQELNLNGYLTIAFGAIAFMVFIMPAYATLPSVVKELKPKEWLKLMQYGI